MAESGMQNEPKSARRQPSEGNPLGGRFKKWPAVNGSFVVDFLRTALRHSGCTNLVEIGCGAGIHLIDADEAFLESYRGVDLGYNVQFAHRHAPKAKLVQSRLEGWQIADFVSRQGDKALIVVTYRLEIAPDSSDVLKTLVKLVEAGHKCIVFLDPLQGGDEELLREYDWTRWSVDGFQEEIAAVGGKATLRGQALRDPRSISSRGAILSVEPAEGSTAGGDWAEMDFAAFTRGWGVDSEQDPPVTGASTPNDMVVDLTVPAYIGGRYVECPEALTVPPDRIMEDEDVIVAIEHAKRWRLPFSIVRVGNGEARVVGYPDYIPPLWLARSYTNWFGDRNNTVSNELIRSEMMAAMVASDIVGVPHGLGGGNDAQWALAHRMLRLYSVMPTSGHLCRHAFHLTALKDRSFEKIVADEQFITVISPHDIREPLVGQLGVKDARWFPIPGQAKFFRGMDERRHYPDVFMELRQNLTVRTPGEIFLIGAGPLGKVYCHWVKTLGGIALDVGSILDVWAGHATRSGFGNLLETYTLGKQA